MLTGEGVSFGIYDIAKSLTIPGWGVIITLLFQSVYMIAVGIERWLTYSKAKAQSRQYAPKVAQALKNSNIDEAINIGDKHKDSHLAMVVSSGLKEFAAHQGNTDISADEMEASKRALERAIAVKTAELKRGLSGLATVGSTAPFVGLFGTVVGIIGAFQALEDQRIGRYRCRRRCYRRGSGRYRIWYPRGYSGCVAFQLFHQQSNKL